MNTILYYLYTKIDDPNDFANIHREWCKDKDFKGRIIVATEGLNGTLSGPINECEEYMNFIKSDDRFSNIEFKIDSCSEHLFDRLTIKVKKYLIKLGTQDHIDPTIDTGIHLSPKDFHRMMKDESTIVLDTRSNYEHYIGKFKNAITLNIDKFYEFPDRIKEHELYLNENNRHKNILTYCTGGVRCETASGYLKKIGFTNVFQLNGGIINYGNENNGEDFEGKCYVFDGRITKDVNKINPKIITTCIICKNDCDIMINCMSVSCDRHVAMCITCNDVVKGCCSLECQSAEKIRVRTPAFYKDDDKNRNTKQPKIKHIKKQRIEKIPVDKLDDKLDIGK